MLPTRQRQYRLIRAGQGFDLSRIDDASVRAPGPGEVVLAVKAASINRRDVMVRKGFYPVGDKQSLVPLSDGAGQVVAVGSGVTRFAVGDRATATFFQGWLDGRPHAATGASSLGGGVDGVLSEYLTLSEHGLVHTPAMLSDEEAATLPCAAVTAWNGLFVRGRLQAGDHVLLQGTGGVSIFGLQFAAAAGAAAIITSSSDDKLERAKKLGAVATINYARTPEWAEAVRAAAAGVGVHHVLEVGGSGTLKQSLAALAPGGHLALIGGLGGFGGDIPAVGLIARGASVSGIFVGSRTHFESMNAFIAEHTIRPIIDRVFDFDSVDAAYAHMESGRHFVKIVIRL